MFFFFKQKTAYEMRISDWSSDVCSSDLGVVAVPVARGAADAAVDDEFGGVLGHFGVEVVLDHPVRGFGEPGLAAELGAARGGDLAGRVVAVGHGGTCCCVLEGIIASGGWSPSPAERERGWGEGVVGRAWLGVWGKSRSLTRRFAPPSPASQERGGWKRIALAPILRSGGGVGGRAHLPLARDRKGTLLKSTTH